MGWIKIDQNLPDHPKLSDLMAAMEWNKEEAIGRLVQFWLWCQKFAEDGDLSKHNDNRLGATVGCCPGEESKRFVEAMVSTCWLDREPYFRVHDWWDHQRDWLQSRFGKTPERWHSVRDRYLPAGSQLVVSGVPAVKKEKKERKKETPAAVPAARASPGGQETAKTGPKLAHPPPEWFEEAWKLYPRKIGRKEALRHFNATVKVPHDLDRVKIALGKYVRYVADKRVAEEFIQHGSTWFNNWQDWEHYGPPRIEQPRRASNPGQSETDLEHKRLIEQDLAVSEDLQEIGQLPKSDQESIEAEARARLPKSGGRFKNAGESIVLDAIKSEVYRERKRAAEKN